MSLYNVPSEFLSIFSIPALHYHVNISSYYLCSGLRFAGKLEDHLVIKVVAGPYKSKYTVNITTNML